MLFNNIYTGRILFLIALFLILIKFYVSVSSSDQLNYIHRQTDWIIWQNTDSGLIALATLPPAFSKPEPGQNAQILPGDKLLKIEYIPILNVATYHTIINATPHGHLRIYEILRNNIIIKMFIRIERTNIIINTSSHILWSVHNILLVIFIIIFISVLYIQRLIGFIINIIILILFIIIFIYISVCLLTLYYTQYTYYTEADVYNNNILFIIIKLIALYTSIHLITPQVYNYRIHLFLRLIYSIGFISVSTLFWCMSAQPILVLRFNELLNLALILIYILLTTKYLTRLFNIKLILYENILYLLIISTLVISKIPFSSKFYHEVIELLFIVSACSFLLLASYTTFRISQVRWLLAGVGVLVIISFFIISTATFIVNKFIPVSLSLFNKQLAYTFFVVVLSYFVYLLYNRNILNVKNLVFRFSTNQPIYQYIAKISESTSLPTLIESVEKEVPKLFKIEFITVWFPPDFWHKTPIEQFSPSAATSIQLPPENILIESIKHLITTDLPWSAEKPLVGLKFPPDLENQLTKYPISLLFPIPVTGYNTGLLIVGNKNRGVFLLSEVALLGQIVRQLRLTISILKLLEKEKELARLALESQLSALRAQINPHFLFNALNSISALVYYDPELAEKAVMKLSEVFRYTLESSKENLAFFEKEIDMVKNYLEIEKIRFGDRLNFSIFIQDADCNTWLVPTLLLQTIVENCIKHGISKIIHAGVVTINAYIELETDRLIVIIYDNGPGIDLNRIKASTGLKNTLERLERLYNRNDLIIFENTGQGTQVTLRLPYIEDLSQTNDN